MQDLLEIAGYMRASLSAQGRKYNRSCE